MDLTIHRGARESLHRANTPIIVQFESVDEEADSCITFISTFEAVIETRMLNV